MSAAAAPYLDRLLTLPALGAVIAASIRRWEEGVFALVVDDSKSARVVLSRMLEKYGIDSDNDGVAEQYMTGAQFAAGLVASPQTADWRWVVSVRVSVLARGITASPGYNDANKVYDLGGGVVFACTPGTNCDFKRHVFTQIASTPASFT